MSATVIGESAQEAVVIGQSSPATCTSLGDDAVAKCKAYQEQRASAKAKRLRGILVTGAMVFALGIGLNAVAGSVLGERTTAAIALKALSTILEQLGFCTLASCPTTDVNLNEALKRHWMRRVVLGLVLGAGCFQRAGLVGVPATVLCLWLAFNGRRPDVPRELPRSFLGDLFRWPDSTTLMSFAAFYLLAITGPLEDNPLVGIAFGVPVVPGPIVWLLLRHRHRRSGGEQGADPTLRFYLVLFYVYLLASYFAFVRGVIGEGSEHFLHSFACGISPILLFAVGRERFFTFFGRRFESAQAESDGAMMAEVLAQRPETLPGMTRWVHRSAPDETFEYFDPRRNWQKGIITEVNDTYFLVELPDGQVERVMYTPTTISSNELLEIARRDLRGIQWSNFSLTLLLNQTSMGNASPADLSMPLSFTDGPDYFLSHSWHDNSQDKYAELVKVAQEFRAHRGRDPVFWLDKVCINQQNISDGLKVLPINVCACKKLLVVCGETYLSRLWCVLELCTLLSFMNEAEAAKRVLFRVLPGSSKSEQELLDDIMNFDVSKARCYDPNEQAHLTGVISALGFDHMNAKMHRLGAALKKQAGEAVPKAPHEILKVDVDPNESRFKGEATEIRIWI